MPHDPRPIRDVPSATANRDAIERRLRDRPPAVFLDYDGTLTPIVDDPADATIDDDVRAVLRALASTCTVAIVSGRDLDDVRGMVDVDGLDYAGSHGFDMLAADGSVTRPAEDHLPALDAAESDLHDRLDDLEGVRIERKRFAIAVHTRGADDATADTVAQRVEAAAGDHPGLRITRGKRILELRPDIDWDKGRALQAFLDALDLDPTRTTPVYVGDDVTDEDGFRGLPPTGLALVVRGEDDDRETVADFALEDTGETIAFLDDLQRRLGDG